MALKKEIELDNGIILNYHRVLSINSITNISTNIEISSYTNKEQRDKEAKYQKLQIKNWSNELTEDEKEELEKGINVYVETTFVSIPYNKDININNAYDYLKTVPKFEGAEDI